MTQTTETFGSSLESGIDRKIEQLLGRIISGTASDAEFALFHELARERSDLMTRPPLPKHRTAVAERLKRAI
jgi:hypothetical protein